MKAFVFSLQKLLEVKETLERAAEERLAVVLRKVHAGRERLKELSIRCQQSIGQIESLHGAQMHRSRLLTHQRYLERIQGQVNAQLQVIVEQEMLADQLRQELCDIVRERKSIEKLRENERRKWLQENRRKDQLEIDEFAVSGFFRRHHMELAVEN